MNTIDSYFEYKMKINAPNLNDTNNEFIVDRKTRIRVMPDGTEKQINWYQFRIPVTVPLSTYDDATVPEYSRVGGITDFRSIRFARIYLNQFSQQTTMRFGTFDLVRSDWRRYTRDLSDSSLPQSQATFNIGVVSAQVNEGNYISPPSVVPEQVNNNNSIIDQNEQALVVSVCELGNEESRAVYKNIDVDMRQYEKLRMFIHAEPGETAGLANNEMIGFIRMGNDLTENYYQIEIPLQVSSPAPATADGYWPELNEINLGLDALQTIKSIGISNATLANPEATFYDLSLIHISEPTRPY